MQKSPPPTTGSIEKPFEKKKAQRRTFGKDALFAFEILDQYD